MIVKISKRNVRKGIHDQWHMIMVPTWRKNLFAWSNLRLFKHEHVCVSQTSSTMDTNTNDKYL